MIFRYLFLARFFYASCDHGAFAGCLGGHLFQLLLLLPLLGVQRLVIIVQLLVSLLGRLQWLLLASLASRHLARAYKLGLCGYKRSCWVFKVFIKTSEVFPNPSFIWFLSTQVARWLGRQVKIT